MRITFRGLYFIGLICCLFLLGSALIFQLVLGLEPCPLCVLTRIIIIGLTAIYFIGTLHTCKKLGQQIYTLITSSLCLIGLGLSIRHVWIQNLPPEQVPACGPSFDYLIQTMPFTEAMTLILSGSGECAKVDWVLLGASIPAWMIGIFIGLLALNLAAMIKNNKG